jgi:hypothetical protein
MMTTVVRSNTVRRSWMLPAAAAVLLTISAIAGLINGMPAPDVIGADALASTVLASP